MVLGICALNQHVDNIYLHSLANLTSEHRVNEALVRGSSVLEAEGHTL